MYVAYVLYIHIGRQDRHKQKRNVDVGDMHWRLVKNRFAQHCHIF